MSAERRVPWGADRLAFPWKSHRTMAQVAETEALRVLRTESRRVWHRNSHRWRLQRLETQAVEPDAAD